MACLFAAAGLIGQSNPEGSNWKLFQAAAAPGSWLMELKRAGHTTFMKPPTLAEMWLLDRVFGGGKFTCIAAEAGAAGGGAAVVAVSAGVRCFMLLELSSIWEPVLLLTTLLQLLQLMDTLSGSVFFLQ